MFKRITLATAIFAVLIGSAQAGDIRLGATSNDGASLHYSISKIGKSGLYLSVSETEYEDELHTETVGTIGVAIGGIPSSRFMFNGSSRNRFITRIGLVFTQKKFLETAGPAFIEKLEEDDIGLGNNFGLDILFDRFVIGLDVTRTGSSNTFGTLSIGVGF